MKSSVNEILHKFREFVSTEGFEKTPILTAYVNTDPTDADNRKDRPGWLIELKNEAKRLKEQLDQQQLKRRDNQNKWSGTEEWAMEQLKDRKSTGRSVVLFTDHESHFSVDLPLPSPTKLYYGFPQLKHMLFSLDQYKKYLVVLLSGSDVRTLEVFLTRTTDEVRHETDLDLLGRYGRSGHSHKHESRTEEYERRFVKDVSAALDKYFLDDPEVDRLILAGNQKQARAVQRGLHQTAKSKLVSVEVIDFKAAGVEVAKHVKDVADRFEGEHDMTVVHDLIARHNRGGSGMVEKQGVDNALENHQVRTLVLPYPTSGEDFDSVIVNATLSGAAIEFVYGEAANHLNEFGGIGAVLYQ